MVKMEHHFVPPNFQYKSVKQKIFSFFLAWTKIDKIMSRVVYLKATWRTFHPKLEKTKKIHPQKNAFYFRKWSS